jgi:hypothetical protein
MTRTGLQHIDRPSVFTCMQMNIQDQRGTFMLFEPGLRKSYLGIHEYIGGLCSSSSKAVEPAKGAAERGHSFPAAGDTLLLIPQQIKNVLPGRNARDVSSHGEEDRHMTGFV